MPRVRQTVEYCLFLVQLYFKQAGQETENQLDDTPARLVGWVAQSVQRLATGWTIRGSNPCGDEIFRTCPHRTWGPPSLLYNGYRFFPGGKERPVRDTDPSPPSIAVVMKGQSYTSTPPMGRRACTEPQCLYKGAIYLFFTLLDLKPQLESLYIRSIFGQQGNIFSICCSTGEILLDFLKVIITANFSLVSSPTVRPTETRLMTKRKRCSGRALIGQAG